MPSAARHSPSDQQKDREMREFMTDKERAREGRRTDGVKAHHDAETSSRSFQVAIKGAIVVSVIESHLVSVITDEETRRRRGKRCVSESGKGRRVSTSRSSCWRSPET
jgi:hypothetical protein